MNMRYVAKRAGVSSATVSRVIHGSPLVKPETAKAVQQVIDELHFVPNTSATTLKYGRSNTYGLIIPDLMNPFFTEFIRDFEALLVDNDYELLIANTEFSEERTKNSVRRMLLRRVEGVVLMSEDKSRAFDALAAKQVPLVTSDRRKISVGVSDVSMRYETGMRQAVRHLRGLGHKSIAFIGGSEGPLTSRIRLDAYRKAMQAEGLLVREEFLATGDFRVEGGDAAMRGILSGSRRPTAVIAINDLTAFGVVRALHAFHISVPSQMSVIGCDDVVLSDILQPPLTTIRSPRSLMARRCMEALTYMREDGSRSGKQFWAETALVPRESTGPAPRERNR